METVIRRLEQAGMALACLFVMLLMLVVSCDAAARYLFKAPLQWSTDLVTHYLLVGAVYFALAGTYQRGYHISIDILHARLPERLRAWADALCSLLAAAVFLLVAYANWQSVEEALRNREFFPGVIAWPVWLSFLPIPIGTALLALRLMHHAAVLLRDGKDPAVGMHVEAVEGAE